MAERIAWVKPDDQFVVMWTDTNKLVIEWHGANKWCLVRLREFDMREIYSGCDSPELVRDRLEREIGNFNKRLEHALSQADVVRVVDIAQLSPALDINQTQKGKTHAT